MRHSSDHQQPREGKPLAEFYGIPFHAITDAKDKSEAEQRMLALLKEYQIDLVVLARYMQILSPEFVEQFPSHIINIHDSFLRAFVGAKPYHQAFERGVKLVGATSHYVTAALDGGPIIEQDVVRVSHRDIVEDMVPEGARPRKGGSLAVRWHVENRILLYTNKTVVFT